MVGNLAVNFSIVCPVHDEINLIPLTLPSFYEVDASEIILCFDNPPHEQALSQAKKVASHYDTETNFLFVERNSEYIFHQAWVRRKGFLTAKHNRILTTDIDLVLNHNVQKAVNLVGKKDVGLASCSKFYSTRTLAGVAGWWRLFAKHVMDKLVYPIWKHSQQEKMQFTTFTGLYALWRPFWLDSEDEGIKSLENPKTQIRLGEKPTFSKHKVCVGEDTYLRDCMERKHKVAYLPDVGAFNIGPQLKDHPHVQFERGRYCYTQGRSMLGAFFTTFFRLQPHYIHGYLWQRRISG